MNRRFFILAGLAALGACATRPAPLATPPGRVLEELEPLYGVTSTWRGITILVASRGCATRADFTSHIERTPGSASALSFARLRLETCPAGARRTQPVSFTYDELGLRPGAPYFVLNPVRPPN
jgi:hypothetical protein